MQIEASPLRDSGRAAGAVLVGGLWSAGRTSAAHGRVLRSEKTPPRGSWDKGGVLGGCAVGERRDGSMCELT
jgi:hypothetical protein